MARDPRRSWPEIGAISRSGRSAVAFRFSAAFRFSGRSGSQERFLGRWAHVSLAARNGRWPRGTVVGRAERPLAGQA